VVVTRRKYNETNKTKKKKLFLNSNAEKKTGCDVGIVNVETHAK